MDAMEYSQLDIDLEIAFRELLDEVSNEENSSKSSIEKMKDYWAGSASASVLSDYRSGKVKDV